MGGFMDFITVDYKKMCPYFIEAFTHVYGDEYHDIIEDKINKALFLQYYDVGGLKSFMGILKKYFQIKLTIKFLEKIGRDVEKYKDIDYINALDSKLYIRRILSKEDYGLVWHLLGPNTCFDFDKFTVPITAFRDDYTFIDDEFKLSLQADVVNYMIDDDNIKIDCFNVEEFLADNKHPEITQKLEEYNRVYDELLIEYKEYCEAFKPYDDYIEEERVRNEGILREKKEEFVKEALKKMPEAARTILAEKPMDELIKIFDMGSGVSSLRYFNSDYMAPLRDKPENENYNVRRIILSQSRYFVLLGIIKNEDELCNKSVPSGGSIVPGYLEFIDSEEIKKYIPDDSIIGWIEQIYEWKMNQAKKRYFTERIDYKTIMKIHNDNDKIKDFIYDVLSNRMVGRDVYFDLNSKKYYSKIFFTIRDTDYEKTFFGNGDVNTSLINIVSNIVDTNYGNGNCGFATPKKHENTVEENEDVSLWKYTLFNRIISDIYSGEVAMYLYNKGIFLMTPKEITNLKSLGIAISPYLGNIVEPLVKDYRDVVTKAKIEGDRGILIDYIGEDNFEALVDCVYRASLLLCAGLEEKIREQDDDKCVEAYFKLLERIKTIYANIASYVATKSQEIDHSEEDKGTSFTNKINFE